MSERFWKSFRVDGRTMHDRAPWPRPVDGAEAEWLPAIMGPLIACRNGYHACRSQDLVAWLGPVLWEVESKGEVLIVEDKVVLRQARLVHRVETWNERTQRLFAADCAEHVLPLFEQAIPLDLRPRLAIATARLYAEGRASAEELAEACSEAAGAAWSARAWRAASAAASSAAKAELAWEVAWSAAWSAAWVAAESAAAWSSAWVAAEERGWQERSLMAYLYPAETVVAP